MFVHFLPCSRLSEDKGHAGDTPPSTRRPPQRGSETTAFTAFHCSMDFDETGARPAMVAVGTVSGTGDCSDPLGGFQPSRIR